MPKYVGWGMRSLFSSPPAPFFPPVFFSFLIFLDKYRPPFSSYRMHKAVCQKGTPEAACAGPHRGASLPLLRMWTVRILSAFHSLLGTYRSYPTKLYVGRYTFFYSFRVNFGLVFFLNIIFGRMRRQI